MEYITIARLAKPYGLKGEIHAFCMTDFPKDRFKKGRAVYARKAGNDPIPLTIEKCHINGEQLVFAFKEVQSIEQAETLQGYDLDMDKEQATLPEGYYRVADLLQCDAYDEEGHRLGKIVDVTSYAPTKNFKIQKEDGKCFYVPFIDEYVLTVELEERKITLHVVKGMI